MGGVDAVALDLPSTSGTGDMVGDADAVSSFAQSLDDAIVLLGHSYGGVVITQAAASIPRLRAVIYLAALRPEIGQSAADTLHDEPKTLLDDAIERAGDRLNLRPTLAGRALFRDSPVEVVEAAVTRLHAQPVATLRQALTQDLPPHCSSHYIVCTDDRSIAPSVQRKMGERCASVTELDSSHMPQFDQAEALVSIIAAYLRELSTTQH